MDVLRQVHRFKKKRKKKEKKEKKKNDVEMNS
jgi:hypothetical protein